MCTTTLTVGAFVVRVLAAVGAWSLIDLVIVGIVWLWIQRSGAHRR